MRCPRSDQILYRISFHGVKRPPSLRVVLRARRSCQPRAWGAWLARRTATDGPVSDGVARRPHPTDPCGSGDDPSAAVDVTPPATASGPVLSSRVGGGRPCAGRPCGSCTGRANRPPAICVVKRVNARRMVPPAPSARCAAGAEGARGGGSVHGVPDGPTLRSRAGRVCRRAGHKRAAGAHVARISGPLCRMICGTAVRDACRSHPSRVGAPPAGQGAQVPRSRERSGGCRCAARRGWTRGPPRGQRAHPAGRQAVCDAFRHTRTQTHGHTAHRHHAGAHGQTTTGTAQTHAHGLAPALALSHRRTRRPAVRREPSASRQVAGASAAVAHRATPRRASAK